MYFFTIMAKKYIFCIDLFCFLCNIFRQSCALFLILLHFPQYILLFPLIYYRFFLIFSHITVLSPKSHCFRAYFNNYNLFFAHLLSFYTICFLLFYSFKICFCNSSDIRITSALICRQL